MKKITVLAGMLAIGVLGHGQTVKNPPPVPKPPQPPKVEIRKFTPPRIVRNNADLDSFYQRNPDVSRLKWRDGQRLVVVRKDNTKEEYNLGIDKEKTMFTEKYGKPPVPPPPPPPVKPMRPPTPPKRVTT